MADEVVGGGAAQESASARGWSRVATHLEAAIAAIPRPNFEAISNPKEMGKRLKKLCKDLKAQLKEAMGQAKEMSLRVYSLLKELAARISDLIARFFQYISDKVKSFLCWISGIINSVKARFAHLD